MHHWHFGLRTCHFCCSNSYELWDTTEQSMPLQRKHMNFQLDGHTDYDCRNLKRDHIPLFGIAMNPTDSFDLRETLTFGETRCQKIFKRGQFAKFIPMLWGAYLIHSCPFLRASVFPVGQSWMVHLTVIQRSLQAKPLLPPCRNGLRFVAL